MGFLERTWLESCLPLKLAMRPQACCLAFVNPQCTHAYNGDSSLSRAVDACKALTMFHSLPGFIHEGVGWLVCWVPFFSRKSTVFMLVVFSNVTDWCVGQKKLLREEARSGVWDLTSLKKGCCLLEYEQILFSGDVRKLARLSKKWWRAGRGRSGWHGNHGGF